MRKVKPKITKVFIRGYPNKQFIGRYGETYGKDVAGLTSKEANRWVVRLDTNADLRTSKRILLHELGHVMSTKQHIARKMPAREKKLLLNRFGPSVADDTYTTRGTTQEIIAEISRVNDQRKYKTLNKQIKKMAPITWNVIQNEEKKFKPQLYWSGQRKKGLKVRFS